MSTRCEKQNLQVITAAPPPNPMDAIVEGFDMVKNQKELQNCDKIEVDRPGSEIYGAMETRNAKMTGLFCKNEVSEKKLKNNKKKNLQRLSYDNQTNNTRHLRTNIKNQK